MSDTYRPDTRGLCKNRKSTLFLLGTDERAAVARGGSTGAIRFKGTHDVSTLSTVVEISEKRAGIDTFAFAELFC
jgi:hypothetical protein